MLARPAQTLGVESFFLQLVSGIQEVLSARRIALLFQVVEDLDTECALYRRWWAERRVDGVLVVDPRTEDPRPELLAALGLPAVVVGGPATPGPDPSEPPVEPSADPVHPLLSTVWADDAKAMARILDHLYGLGHRRIVHIAGLPGLAHTARRIRSLRTEADRRGLDHRQVHSVTTDYSDAEGAEATRRLLDAARPPTAIIYDNDVMAVAERLGRRRARNPRTGRAVDRGLGRLGAVPGHPPPAHRTRPRHPWLRQARRPGTPRGARRRPAPDRPGRTAAPGGAGEHRAALTPLTTRVTARALACSGPE